MEYVAVDTEDLTLYFDFAENLQNYTAQIHYYLLTAGTSSSTYVTATVSTQTTALTYVTIDCSTAIFTSKGVWCIWPEITSASNDWRAGEPVKLEIRQKGIP